MWNVTWLLLLLPGKVPHFHSLRNANNFNLEFFSHISWAEWMCCVVQPRGPDRSACVCLPPLGHSTGLTPCPFHPVNLLSSLQTPLWQQLQQWNQNSIIPEILQVSLNVILNSAELKFNNFWSEVKVTQSCPALCHPMDSIAHGILQARILEWIAFLFRGSSQPRDQTQVSHIAGGFFTFWATSKALCKGT